MTDDQLPEMHEVPEHTRGGHPVRGYTSRSHADCSHGNTTAERQDCLRAHGYKDD
jgi:hypothetical protein